jgi:predicted MFS family arabinose efflux permease
VSDRPTTALARRLGLSDAVLASVAVAFSTSIGESALIPLLPMIRHRASLGAFDASVLIGLPTLVMLVAVVPFGLLATRIGDGRLVLLAAVIGPVGLLVGAIEPSSHAALMASRALSGVASAALWTIGPAIIATSARRVAGMSALISVAGLAWLVGPAGAGVIADAFGVRSAFVALALVSAPAIILTVRAGIAPGHRPLVRTATLRPALGATVNDPAVRGAVLGMVVLGIAAGATSLVAPFALDRNGLSAGAIGAWYAVSSLVWIGWARLAGRVRDVRVGARIVAGAVVVIALGWLLPSASASTPAVIALLLLSGTGRALLNTWVFVLASNGRAEGQHAPTVTGLMNAAWSVAALGTPLLLGSLVDRHLAWAFALTGATIAAVAGAIVLGAPRRRTT